MIFTNVKYQIYLEQDIYSIMAKDPVCGMDVDEKKSTATRHMGKAYHFCCPSCKTLFERDPSKYT